MKTPSQCPTHRRESGSPTGGFRSTCAPRRRGKGGRPRPCWSLVSSWVCRRKWRCGSPRNTPAGGRGPAARANALRANPAPQAACGFMSVAFRCPPLLRAGAARGRAARVRIDPRAGMGGSPPSALAVLVISASCGGKTPKVTLRGPLSWPQMTRSRAAMASTTEPAREANSE